MVTTAGSYTGSPTTKALGPTTDYAGNWNVLNDSPGGNVVLSNLSIQTIKDGSSNTILVGEKSLSSDQYPTRYGWNWDETISWGGAGGTGRGAFWDAWNGRRQRHYCST